MTPALRRDELEQLARGEGLRVIGVTTAEPFHELATYLVDHIARGHTKGMAWFTPARARESCNPATLHPAARSIVSVAVPFWSGPVRAPDDGVLRGRIARYAWGQDYHATLRRRMRALVNKIETALGRRLDARTLVDTARIVDRAVAARAGVGWYGKNSMLIVPGHGSWVMLGEIILDIELQPDLPLRRDCGRCAICIDRCPTQAIVAPYRIDAPRCVSYLTIEERGPIPIEFRAAMGMWVFGCDVCQDVCPYTGAATPTEDPAFAPRTVENAYPSLERLATMTEAEFRATYSGTAVTRAKRSGMARNAAIALGNSSDPRAEPILRRLLASHDEPLARSHAAWGLSHLLGEEARRALQAARRTERDPTVLHEIDLALAA